MKKYVSGILAIVLAISFSAFTTIYSSGSPKFAGVYWIFNGNPSIPSDVSNPLKYSLAPGNVPTCNTGTKLCNIVADPQGGDPSHPNLSTEVQSMRKFKN